MPNPYHDPKNGQFASKSGGLAAGLAAEHKKRTRIVFTHHDGSDLTSFKADLTKSKYDRALISGPAATAKLPDGKVVGVIQWMGEDHPQVAMGVTGHGEVAHVWVDPDYRRKGIATALYDFAKSKDLAIHHSETRTELGNLWVTHEQGRRKKTALKRGRK